MCIIPHAVTQSSAPEDGQNNCPKHVELTEIINKPLLLLLVGCLNYLYKWCTVKQISDNEMYLLIKYIRSVLWREAKRLSCTEDAWCPKVISVCMNVNMYLHSSTYIQITYFTRNSEFVFRFVYDYLFYWTNSRASNRVFITQILFRLININYLSRIPDMIYVHIRAKICFRLYLFSHVQHKCIQLYELLYFVRLF